MFHQQGTGFDQVLESGVSRVSNNYYAGESKDDNDEAYIKKAEGAFDPYKEEK